MIAPAAQHPTDQTLQAFALGKLDGSSASSVDGHIEDCPACRRRVAEMSADTFLGRLRDARGIGETTGDRPSPRGSSESDSIPPGLIDHPDYADLRELGRGGMGVVYLARNTIMDRLEVLKVLNPQLMDRPHVLERFLREIRAVARLRHPNIVAAYSATRIGGSLVLSMEYVEGLDLSKMVKLRGPMPVAHAAAFVHQAALGLQHAHEEGLVHRDIKPGNLMLSRKGAKPVVKVLDFGLARVAREAPVDGALTHAGQMLGTPDFIAPEQTLDAQKADIRADIYSLGCTLYYLLSGGPPFRGTSLYDILQAHHSIDARPLNLLRPEVPAELAAVVSKMMAKEPHRRFQTPDEVARALTPFFKKSASVPAPGPEISYAFPPIVDPLTAPTEAATASPPLAAPSPSAAPEVRWSSLIDTREETPSSAVDSPIPPSRRPPWLWPSVLGGILLVAMAAFGILKLRTSNGVIVLEGAPDGAEVSIDGSKASLIWPDGGGPLRIEVPAGKRGVRVEKDGFKAFGEEVTVEAGGKQEIKVSLLRDVEPAKVSGDGFVPLFNGRDLAGWKTHPDQPGNWRVENGVLIGSGPATSHLYSERGDYADFHLRAEVRVNDGGNSGIYFRSSSGPRRPERYPSWPVGYEAQINSSARDPYRTGSLYSSSGADSVPFKVRVPPVQAKDWFVLEIIARGSHISIKVNGLPEADYSDPKRAYTAGHIALQQHDPETFVEFRRIEIKEIANASVTGGTDGPPTRVRQDSDALVGKPPLPRDAQVRGDWSIEGDELVQNQLSRELSYALFGDPNWSDYDFAFKAKASRGTQGFIALFQVADPAELPRIRHGRVRKWFP